MPFYATLFYVCLPKECVLSKVKCFTGFFKHGGSFLHRGTVYYFGDWD